MSVPASRRGFLEGFAALSVGGSSGGVATAALAGKRPDAELLALGVEMDRAAAAYLDRLEDLARAVALFQTIKPPLPAELIVLRSEGIVATEFPPDALGCFSGRDVNYRIRIPCRHDLDRRVSITDGRTRLGRDLRRLQKLSDAYHSAHEAAREEAGTDAADHARHMAGRLVSDVSKKIAETPATTLEGVAVKARAELAFVRSNRDEGGLLDRMGITILLESLAALRGKA